MRRVSFPVAAGAALIVAVGTLVSINLGAVAAWALQPAQAEESPTAVSEADLTYFYKAPSPARAGQLIAYFDALRAAEKPGTRPPLEGFFAAVFQRYPADIDKMIPVSLSPQMSGLLAVSLQLAGQEARAKSVVETLKARDAVVPDLASIPKSLEAIEAVGPSEFDMLWGASFATGDPRYCSKILTRFASVANVDANADDLVELVRKRESGADQHWIVDKRGKDKAVELIAVSTALWALDSNARQHAFVAGMLTEYVKAHATEPAAKAVSRLTRQYGYYQLAKLIAVTQTAPGKPSATINISYFSQILADLERHAGNYPPHFEFADDRKRAEGDITAISQMLDPLTESLSKNPPILLRLALLHAIGFNLDIPDSMAKTLSAFNELLSLTPDDPQANLRYGAFLAATTRKGEGIPFLEKARSLGAADADYWLGLSYMNAGDKAKAIENLQAYTKRVPGDQRAAMMLEAIRADKVTVKVVKPAAAP